MSAPENMIADLARAAGISEEYHDVSGRRFETSPETRAAILEGFGFSVASQAEVREGLERVRALRHGLVPALVPVQAGRPVRVPVRPRGASDDVRWRLVDEGGAAQEGRGSSRGAPTLDLPGLRPGYHRLEVRAGGERAEALVIAAPRLCWEPEPVREGSRLWGVTAQVYGLRSGRDFGIGDYSDVALAAENAGRLGASFLGLSPVHALFAADRTKISPYSPSSRLFLETLFIDPTAVDGFAGSEAARLLEEQGLAERIRALRDAALVDHAAVWDVKRPLLDVLWSLRRERGDPAGLDAFRREGGAALQAHATFEALSERFRAEGRWWLGDWPDAFKDARSSEVRAYAESEGRERVAFHAWLQWQADLQLGQAAERAKASGMSVGLYRDLAVGADRGGSEVWADPESVSATLSVGAPPDPLGPQGQNWGLPPFNPLNLEARGLQAFRALVTANMRHAGAIRIDHAFQLQRLFIIPEGRPASEGAYVAFPFEALLAVLRLESHRHRCLVIAEDLGTAPQGFSDAIMAAGVMSYRVQPFERSEGGTFNPPESYPQRALAVLSTHDLPTFRGWWRGLDIDLRQTLGVFDRDASDRERGSRASDRARLSEALADEGLLPSPEVPEEPPLEGAVRLLARTRSALAGLQLEDVSGELNQANLPGLDNGHPNWRRRLSSGVEALTAPGGPLAKLAAAMAEEGRGVRPGGAQLAAPPPRATYRFQFHKDFTFDDAVKVVPYLKRLGISHVYASPIHTARPGSTHGYDIVDHARINPELGGEEGFVRLTDALKEHGLGLILDIVPNHMGVGGADNRWWLSALEWGALSPVSKAFDIDWERLGAHGKLVVPFLGDRYGEALEKGDLKLAFHAHEGAFSVWHWEHRFPVCPLSYPIILDRALAALPDLRGHEELLAVSERLRAMEAEPLAERRAGFPEEADGLKRRLADTVAGSPEMAQAIERAVALVNGTPGIPESFGTLHRILEAQSYRLAHWRVAASDINYRRFFDINGLAGLRVEEPEVLELTHAMVLRLVREGRIQGLRIDHIDGLADPEGYARALQGLVGPGFYVVVEKILEPGEELRPWPVAGTTGYDVLNLIDGVLVDPSAADAMERLYRRSSELEGRYGELLREAKTGILETSFASELEVLVSDLKRIADADRRTRDFTVYAMRRALIEIVARFPVYRSYIGEEEPESEDRRLIEETVASAKRRSALPDRSVHDFAAAVLLGEVETEGPGRPAPDHIARFRRRFQQLTGPVMAKSLEDTLFYRYARLLALNEVGGDPGHFGVEPDAFHRANGERLREWPHSMIATATHDTKRGEDARARLLALSELPEPWAEAHGNFEDFAEAHLKRLDGEAAPDGNDRYILLQALLGAWPNELLDRDDPEALEAFRGRMEGFVEKALREAKRHSSWVNVNEAYEGATKGLLAAALTSGSPFLERVRPFARRLAGIGMVNGLARTALKLTLPGVPDTYQGTEFWDLSLVDPDNRRPVDYEARARALDEGGKPGSLLSSWADGRIKQLVTARLLADRAEAPGLYAEGSYEPLRASGDGARHVLGFVRTLGEERLAVAVPRLVARASHDGTPPLGAGFWGETRIGLPAGRWRDAITGAEVEVEDGGHPAGSLFGTLPVAVLRARA